MYCKLLLLVKSMCMKGGIIMINIYCDESCHMRNDDSSLMVIGGLSCPKDKTRLINVRIREIKEKHKIYRHAEIKWTKVSKSKLEMYKELIDLFFSEPDLKFRAVVALDKKELNLDKYSLSYDDWYHRIYYLVLREMTYIGDTYDIFADIKDTLGSERIESLKRVLNLSLSNFYDDTIRHVQLVRSDQIEIMGLVDLLIGAVGYANRKLDTSSAKIELIKHIETKLKYSITSNTTRSITKFNVFLWQPRGKY